MGRPTDSQRLDRAALRVLSERRSADDSGRPSVITRAFRWFFESRETGKITLWQWPNIPLWTYIAAAVVRTVSNGGLSSAAGVVATVALVVWAVLEVWRGVNPFRRVVGALVLLGQLAMLLR